MSGGNDAARAGGREERKEGEKEDGSEGRKERRGGREGGKAHIPAISWGVSLVSGVTARALNSSAGRSLRFLRGKEREGGREGRFVSDM